jgi:predicted ATP-binding protein involved in virulence
MVAPVQHKPRPVQYKIMIFKKIQLTHFRCFKAVSVELHPRLNVFVGNNGQGKTAFLDAIAVGLGAVLTHLPATKGNNFRSNDLWQELPTSSGSAIRDQTPISALNQAPYVRVMLETTDGISWDRTEKRDRSKQTQQAIPPDKKLGELHHFLDNIINDVQAGLPTSLPVMVYYGTDRAGRSSLSNSEPRYFNKTFTRFKALFEAMKPSSRVDNMVERFAFQEDIERREKENRGDLEYRQALLESVRQAIYKVIPYCTDIRTTISPLRLKITLEPIAGKKNILFLDQLSDGYRAMLALVTDLALRMAQANPHLENPLQAEAIVLIDEVDLHLHPQWQQTVLPNLLSTFEKTQFIVTTHSPQVLTTVEEPECIHSIVWENGKVQVKQPNSCYGAESSRLLKDILVVEPRPQNTKMALMLKQYFELIEQGNGEELAALDIRAQLEKWSRGDEMKLIKADMEIRRRQVFGV